MRTKALLLGAMIGAASLVTSMAQVYSVNIVGYVNITIPTGFSIIANPLNASGGNTIANVMPNPPVSVTIYKYDNATGYKTLTYDAEFMEWSPATTVVNPGEGLFIYNPSAPFTYTFVGEVAIGNGTQTMSLPHGYNLIASIIPQTGKLSTDLGYVGSSGANGDAVYKYVPGTGYQTYTWDAEFAEWSPEPTINVGEGFFLLRGDAGGTWTRNFNVGP